MPNYSNTLVYGSVVTKLVQEIECTIGCAKGSFAQHHKLLQRQNIKTSHVLK